MKNDLKTKLVNRNLYLIDRFFVKDSLTDNQTITDLINNQFGFIKDTPYINDLQKVESLV